MPLFHYTRRSGLVASFALLCILRFCHDNRGRYSGIPSAVSASVFHPVTDYTGSASIFIRVLYSFAVSTCTRRPVGPALRPLL